MPCKNHPFVEENLTRCARCGDAFCPDCIVAIGGYPYCATCKVESMRDLRSGVPVHQLEMATIGRRFLAYLIDGLLIGVPLMLLLFGAGALTGMFNPNAESEPNPVFGLFILLFYAVALFGPMVYEGLMLGNGGQTIGKKLMKIKVVTPEGNDITKGQAWGRAAMRQLLALFCALLDYAFAFGQERACIHDQVAKTRVVDWNA
jgi:uncharacterized RDD family membrane protein YckC